MTDDLGKLILRVTLGFLVLLHGIAKLRTGVSGLEAMLVKSGLPDWFAYGVYAGEVLGPIMVILGLATRTGALLIVGNMLFAIYLVHAGDVFSLTKQGGWAIELQAMYLFTALALMLMSPGKYSITRRF
jgi:putative oxidoreductase